ncbi:MAG TPA: cellulase family glycosylhydrolase [Pseudonocardiaceae bacterium]
MHPFRTTIVAAGAVAAVLGGTVFAAALPSSAAPSPTAATAAVGAGFWHTSGNKILDSAGDVVRIAGINWYGFETPDEIAHGLWAQDYHAVVDAIKNLGYNTIRIPFSNQMVEKPIIPQNFSMFNSTGPINTDLAGLNSLQILDKIVAYAGTDGLKVILDDHRSDAGESAEENGLWYTAAFTNQNWLTDWATMAKRYAGNPTVIGFDLRNEPHTPAGVAYANGATWGTGDPNTDIRLAYEAAGNEILGLDPSALIFAEGIGETPNAAGGFDSTWWGGDLELAGQFPVTLTSPGHVVYSAHDYGPSLFQQTWFNATTTTASLAAVWNQFWGYLYQNNTAPIWVGEFGTGNVATDVSNTATGSQGQWFNSLVTFIGANPGMGWTYWALNGEDSFALLDNGYDATPVSAAKQSLLKTIQFPLTGTITAPPPPTTGTGTAPPTTTSAPPPPSASCSAVYSVVNAWQGGFQAGITIKNTGTTAINNWTLAWDFPGAAQVSSLWNATDTQTGKHVVATAAAFDATIAPGASVMVGFTANDPTADPNPTAFSLNGSTCTS